MGILEGTLRFGNLVQSNFVLEFKKISMVQCKAGVSLVPRQWKYCSLAKTSIYICNNFFLGTLPSNKSSSTHSYLGTCLNIPLSDSQPRKVTRCPYYNCNRIALVPVQKSSMLVSLMPMYLVGYNTWSTNLSKDLPSSYKKCNYNHNFDGFHIPLIKYRNRLLLRNKLLTETWPTFRLSGLDNWQPNWALENTDLQFSLLVAHQYLHKPKTNTTHSRLSSNIRKHTDRPTHIHIFPCMHTLNLAFYLDRLVLEWAPKR